MQKWHKNTRKYYKKYVNLTLEDGTTHEGVRLFFCGTNQIGQNVVALFPSGFFHIKDLDKIKITPIK
jgi:hypothetical protein